MQLAPGTRLGPYEVIAAAGAGGMGEVYRARDTRLDRVVAIKILPPNLADTTEARQRFDREARAVSSLNHPHICALYDVGHQEGIHFLVMEYLEGETLAARLDKGPLPLDELLRIAMQIASALDRAHRQGVIHRDLKPGNVMLTKAGAKLVDFGLAKAAQPAPGTADLSATPTVSKPLTVEGTMVGTFQYMAPEQIESGVTDARSEIFSFGLILYEMATGQRAFEGRTHASLIAAILKEEPRPLAELAPMTPPALDRVVRTCLAKDPEQRWQAVHDVHVQLRWLAEHASEGSAAPGAMEKARRQEKIAWVAISLLLLAVVLLGVVQFRDRPQPAQPVRSSLMPPSNWTFVPDNFAIAPDGSKLAFVAVGAEGKNTLWVRALASASAQQLYGTEDAMLPFWSPDSHRIGFFAGGKLKIADSAGGGVRTLCDAPLGRGGTWNREDTIVFSPFIAGSALRVSAGGGVPVPVTKTPSGGTRWPFFLPDGNHFLYFQDWTGPGNTQGNGIFVGSLDGSDSKLVFSEITGNVLFAAGHLLYVRDRRLVAQPFDVATLTTTGPPVPFGDQELEKELAFYHSGYSVSENGALVFQSASDLPLRFIWFDKAGKELGQIPADRLRDPSISPDGRYLAATSDDLGNGKRYIRVFDLARGVSIRLTDGGIEEVPVWSRDGTRITYISTTVNKFALAEVPADGSGSPRILLESAARMIPNDHSPDGSLIFMNLEEGPSFLTALSPADQKKTKMGPGAEAQVSPDGKWIAFVPPQANQVEVRPYPGPGARIQISSEGGSQPRWSRDGKQLYFLTPDKRLMAVDFDSQRQSVSAFHMLFQTRITSSRFVLFQYDVSPDGRFLINSFPSNTSAPLTLVTNWTAQLKR